jgi:glutaryl-CoA dehydrogenase
MAGFAGVDYIDFDSQLNDEEKLVRQTARQFVDNEVIPIIEKHSREGTFPKHVVPQLGELGFLAPAWKATAAPACPTSRTD